MLKCVGLGRLEVCSDGSGPSVPLGICHHLCSGHMHHHPRCPPHQGP